MAPRFNSMGTLTPKYFYSFMANVRIQGRCAALSRSVPWNEVLGTGRIEVRKLDFQSLDRRTPFLGSGLANSVLVSE